MLGASRNNEEHGDEHEHRRERHEPHAMDPMLEEHFRQEAAGDVAGTLATYTDESATTWSAIRWVCCTIGMRSVSAMRTSLATRARGGQTRGVNRQAGRGPPGWPASHRPAYSTSYRDRRSAAGLLSLSPIRRLPVPGDFDLLLPTSVPGCHTSQPGQAAA